MGDDLEVTRTSRRPAGSGACVSGTASGHRFDALVFPEHAVNPDWEIGDSRISKLWVQRLSDERTVFNWDRGLGVPPTDGAAAGIIDCLATGLAELVYAQ